MSCRARGFRKGFEWFKPMETLERLENNRFFFFRKLSTANASTSPAETDIKKVSFRRLVTGEEWGGGVEGNNQSSSPMLALETFI